MNREDLKEKLLLASRIIDRENLARPMGHVTVRIPGTDTFLVTRNVAPGMAVLDDILVCDVEGKILEGKYSATFSEMVIYTAIYKKREDIHGVAHTHSPYVTALSMTGETLLPASFDAAGIGLDPIPQFENIDFIDKQAYGEQIADLLGPNKAVILRGHGAVVVGGSIEEATYNAVRLETAAKLQLLAMSTGKLVSFTDEEKQPLIEFRKRTTAKGGTTTAHGRAWLYYESLLKK